jgi:tetratricopeptide (TPR) repeat protein
MHLALLLAALSAGALPSLDKGVTQYDALEYESAVASLKKAETEALTVEDRARTQLYLGLSYAELAKWRDAESAFRNALVLEPTIQIPVKTSPKIQKLFGDLQAQFSSARQAAQADAPRAAVAEAPVPEPERAAVEVSSSKAEPAALPLRPLLLLGGGVVAAGAGVAFGLASRSSSAAARDEPIQIAASDHAGTAEAQAVAANVLFAAATTLAVAAVLDYLLPSSKAGEP